MGTVIFYLESPGHPSNPVAAYFPRAAFAGKLRHLLKVQPKASTCKFRALFSSLY
jgi:hypothetical protein